MRVSYPLSGLFVQGKKTVLGQRAFLFGIIRSPVPLRVKYTQSAFFDTFTLEHNDGIVFLHQVTKSHCPICCPSTPQALFFSHTKRAQRRSGPFNYHRDFLESPHLSCHLDIHSFIHTQDPSPHTYITKTLHVGRRPSTHKALPPSNPRHGNPRPLSKAVKNEHRRHG